MPSVDSNASTNVRLPVAPAISVDELWAILEPDQGPTALFDVHNNLIRSNESFEHYFPNIALLSEVIANDKASSQTETVCINDETLVLKGNRFSESGLFLIRLATQPLEKDQLQSYLEARDTMFTMSRTVSVSEMAMTLAHEINTPIGTISNLLHVVQRKLSRMEAVPEDILTALSSCAEQTSFTRDVIDRIRNYTQMRQPSRETLSVQAMVEEAIGLLDWHFSLHNCTVQNQLPEALIFVEGDRVMLQQVILNLLKNAADAMSDCTGQRLIEITAETKRSKLRIKIRDHGEGLGSSGGSLFVPFVSDKPTGMGIGLNICRSFLELHAGRMWLSNANGAGCVATIELPLPEEHSL